MKLNNTLTKQLAFLETLSDDVYTLSSLTPYTITLACIIPNTPNKFNDIRAEALTALIQTVFDLPACIVIVN